jgi:hypothetical protein
VVITGSREQEVEVVNKNGELKLRMPFLNYIRNDITIKLYYKKLDGISVSEGASVASDDILMLLLFWI